MHKWVKYMELIFCELYSTRVSNFRVVFRRLIGKLFIYFYSGNCFSRIVILFDSVTYACEWLVGVNRLEKPLTSATIISLLKTTVRSETDGDKAIKNLQYQIHLRTYSIYNTHTHTHIYIYIYICGRVKCVCVYLPNPSARLNWPVCSREFIPFPRVLFTNPSARAGYDTRSIFKRSLTGLNSEFSFS